MGAAFSGQMNEVALAKRTAATSRMCGRDFRALVAPDVKGEQRPPQLVWGADQEFQCLASLKRSDQVYGGVQDSRGLAGLERTVGRIRENAGQTRRLAGQNIQRDSIAPNRGGVDPGY